MKNTFLVGLLFIVSFAFVSCANHDSRKQKSDDSGLSEGLPIIKFETEEYNFGKILQGEKVSYTFKFKNIGKQNLIIKNATASCGCTVPKFSQKPIASGEQGEIEVIFDSDRRAGRQVKSVSIWTNCEPEKYQLQITAEIAVPK